jgi:tRNA threonylcarbamoyladenosine biosynthesis protein TsaE
MTATRQQLPEQLTVQIRTRSVEETRAAGARLAAACSPGDVFGLVGELGAGKTEFVRGMVEALAPGAEVRSPTFTLINTYQTPSFPIHHFDFYRLKSVDDFGEIGLDEYLAGDGVCVIEWADRFSEVLPEETRIIRFRTGGDDERLRVIELD